METKKFDLVVVGAGPGGYVAAIKAAQLGKKVALVEKNHLGGTCLNVGCIPTKTLIANAHVLQKVKKASEFGIVTGPISFNFEKMKLRKDEVVEKIRKSLEGLLLTNAITIIRGSAQFHSPFEIKVKGEESFLLSCNKIIIATGSLPLDVGAFPCDHTHIFNSTSILELTELPKSLAIIGGGYIGCEFASLYAELGVKVSIIEALPSLLTTQGKDIAKTLTRAFEKKNIEIHTATSVERIEKTSQGLRVFLKNKEPLECEKALVAVGRKIDTKDLLLEKAAVKIDERGAIVVDETMQTTVDGIYAIGDVTGKMLLAHVASHQAIVAAKNACGEKVSMNYNVVPSVIFTEPEIAIVGKNAEELEKNNIEYIVGSFPFQALGKSIAEKATEGAATILAEKKTGQILGGYVIGEGASSLIAEIALAMANELTIESISDTIHAHPTLPEAWMEAALLTENTPIHFPPKKTPR